MKGLHTIPDYSETYKPERERPRYARCSYLHCGRKFEKSSIKHRFCQRECENKAGYLKARLEAKFKHE